MLNVVQQGITQVFPTAPVSHLQLTIANAVVDSVNSSTRKTTCTADFALNHDGNAIWTGRVQYSVQPTLQGDTMYSWLTDQFSLILAEAGAAIVPSPVAAPEVVAPPATNSDVGNSEQAVEGNPDAANSTIVDATSSANETPSASP